MTVTVDEVDQERFKRARDEVKAEYAAMQAALAQARQALRSSPLPRPVLGTFERYYQAVVNAVLLWDMNDVDWQFPELSSQDIRKWSQMWYNSVALRDLIVWLQNFGSQDQTRRLLETPQQAEAVRGAMQAAMLQRRTDANNDDFWRDVEARLEQQRADEERQRLISNRARERSLGPVRPIPPPPDWHAGLPPSIAPTSLPHSGQRIRNPHAGPGEDPFGFPWGGADGLAYRDQLELQRVAAQNLVEFTNDVLVLLRNVRSSFNDLLGSLKVWFYQAMAIFIAVGTAVVALLVALGFGAVTAGTALWVAVATFAIAIAAQVMSFMAQVETIRKNVDTLNAAGRNFEGKFKAFVRLSDYGGRKWPDPTDLYNATRPGSGPVIGRNPAGVFRPITGSRRDRLEGFTPAD